MFFLLKDPTRNTIDFLTLRLRPEHLEKSFNVFIKFSNDSRDPLWKKVASSAKSDCFISCVTLSNLFRLPQNYAYFTTLMCLVINRCDF